MQLLTKNRLYPRGMKVPGDEAIKQDLIRGSPHEGQVRGLQRMIEEESEYGQSSTRWRGRSTLNN